MNNKREQLKNEIAEKLQLLKNDPDYMELSKQDDKTREFNETVEALLVELENIKTDATDMEIFGLQSLIAIMDNCLSVQSMSDIELEKPNDSRMKEIYDESLECMKEVEKVLIKVNSTYLENVPEEHRVQVSESITNMNILIESIRKYMVSLDAFKIKFENKPSLALVNLYILKEICLKETE